MYKKILIATDGTSLSKKAVGNGLALAESLGAEIVIVKVVGRYISTYFEGGYVLPNEDIERIEKQWTDEAQVLVDAVKQMAAGKGIKAKAVVVRSNYVADAIISTATKNKCHLIVMSSHGRRGLKGVLLGSETQHVLTHSKIPVLVLR
jgi:nucleotide-binding universal stress UspA family protein